MQIVSDEMIKCLPSDILSNIIKDRINEIEEGKTLFARWCKSRTSDNSGYAKIATKISKIVHDNCDNVPHDIGMTILDAIRDDFA